MLYYILIYAILIYVCKKVDIFGGNMVKKLGELLVKENLISPEQLQKAIQEQQRHGGRLGTHLTRMGFVNDDDLAKFLSKQYGLPSVNLKSLEIDPEIIQLIPKELAKKHKIIPINRTGSTIIVAMVDPSNIFAIDDIKFHTGYNVEVVVATEKDIDEAFTKYYESGMGTSNADLDDILGDFDDVEAVNEGEDDVDISSLEGEAEQAPVIKLVNAVLMNAIQKKASDIHVEPYEKSMRIRFRVDGDLREIMKPPLKLKNAIVSRLKIMAGLDIAERRLPQDGRIKLKIGKNKEMDFRVSVLPTLFGEKVVMRLLDKSNLQLDMTKLGFQEAQLKDFQNAIHQPYGMVLVTGPTGSGKTTTLYSALSELNTEDVNLSTAEDPVEFNLNGINQVNVKEDIGLTFASALRSFLRQDPDIIMVGEIRDFETAEIAIKAALTGHMVLSTLHTNDAPSTITRLLNMGIEPFLVSSALNAIVAQRLARKICSNCKEEIEVTEPMKKSLLDAGAKPEELDNFKVYKGKGCEVCDGTGYKGRVALYEVLIISEPVKELILNGASSLEIKKEAIRMGMKTLRRSGLDKINEGVTSLEEVLKVSAAD